MCDLCRNGAHNGRCNEDRAGSIGALRFTAKTATLSFFVAEFSGCPIFCCPFFWLPFFSVVFSVFVISDNFVLLFFPTMAIFVAEFSHCPIFREPFLPLPFFLLPFFQLPFLPFTGALQNDWRPLTFYVGLLVQMHIMCVTVNLTSALTGDRLIHLNTDICTDCKLFTARAHWKQQT